MTTTTVRLTRPMIWNGQAAPVGTVIEVDADMARHWIHTGRAVSALPSNELARRREAKVAARWAAIAAADAPIWRDGGLWSIAGGRADPLPASRQQLADWWLAAFGSVAQQQQIEAVANAVWTRLCERTPMRIKGVSRY